MHVVHVRNVCQALPEGINYLLEHGAREDSRAGPVLVAPGPVTTVYQCPRERVLTNSVRDANPFFHLYEAIWMLAGRDESASLTRYVRNFSQFAEPGGEIHGAYGRRWRSALGFDQLDVVVAKLRQDPTSRQCVIQMWEATAGGAAFGEGPRFGEHQDDLRGSWRDRPCNTHVYLRVRPSELAIIRETPTEERVRVLRVGERVWLEPVLDITVCCRSNDAVLGAYGANAVHFSVLQEYLAARIGVGVGTYYQVSNNFHVYEAELERLRGRAARHVDGGLMEDRYSTSRIMSRSMFDAPEQIDRDVQKFCRWHDRGDHSPAPQYANEWFLTVATRAARSHTYFRSKEYGMATTMALAVEAPDWSTAMDEWIQRRAR